MVEIRQPIVTVCGHVDHGKTSISDMLRGTNVQEGEVGGITQKISFTLYPLDKLKSSCPLIEKSGINLTIPGFLLIDTPGHAAFTNLRKRGGSLADLAVLVIDVNEGIKPQTAEVIQILKHNKTPFVIALNKIDNVHGWRNFSKGKDFSLKDNIESQPINTKQNFSEKYLTLIGSLSSYGLEADLYYNINDFTKKVALVPTSARTGEGIQELIMVLCGLSQRYLIDKLKLGSEAKGIILEIKNEKGMVYAEAVLHDGELNRNDEIAVANLFGDAIITKIRILEEILPLSSKFKAVEKAKASTGLRMQLSEKSNVLPGMPFLVFKNNKDKIESLFKKEVSDNIQTDKTGIIAKADSLGSLEALLTLLKEARIPVVKAGIGNICKADIISAKANLDIDQLDAVVVGFNVKLDDEAFEIKGNIPVFQNEVIYKLIEDLSKFRDEKRKEIEKERLMGLATIAKVQLLKQYVFRNSNPAVFGVRVEGGKIVSGLNLISDKGEKVGKLKNIQAENKSVETAEENMEVAVSIPGVNYERELNEVSFLFSDISESQFRSFKKNKDLLTVSEIKVLQEIAEIKRKEKADWGI